MSTALLNPPKSDARPKRPKSAEIPEGVSGGDPPLGETRIPLGPFTWEEFITLQNLVEERGARVTFLDGLVEIMSVSQNHEILKSIVGHLLETYFIEKDIDFTPVGNATLASKIKEASAEPDESYCFGELRPVPDLAIEIALNSGGLKKLEVYRRLGVKEVWTWTQGRLIVNVLQEDGQYELAEKSFHFPDFDFALLAECLAKPSLREARRAFLAGLD